VNPLDFCVSFLEVLLPEFMRISLSVKWWITTFFDRSILTSHGKGSKWQLPNFLIKFS